MLLALGIAWAFPSDGADVAPIQIDQVEQAVFGGGLRQIETIFRNRTEQPLKLALSSRLYQASASTIAPVEETRPFRTITLDAGEALIETIGVKLPAVRSETTFILQWHTEERKLGRTVIHVFPTNLLELSSLFTTSESVGLFDPEGAFRGAFESSKVRLLENVDDLGSFDGSLLITAAAQKEAPQPTKETIVNCAKRGTGVIWIQPSTSRELIGLPSSYVVDIGGGRVVVAQASSLTNFAHSPTAQLTMIRLAELATGRRKLALPKGSGDSQEHL